MRIYESRGFPDGIRLAGSHLEYSIAGFPGLAECNGLGNAGVGITIQTRPLSGGLRGENRGKVPGSCGLTVAPGDCNERGLPEEGSKNPRSPPARLPQNWLGRPPDFQKCSSHDAQV